MSLNFSARFSPNQVVSLGAWCQVSHQLKSLKFNVVRSPFDWLVTPFDSLIAMLDDRCARVGISASPYRGNIDAICDNYGAIYAHEFSKNEDGSVFISGQSLENARSKLTHKMRRLEDACRTDAYTLFVRMGGMARPPVPWPYLTDNEILSAQNINKLNEQIKRLCPSGKYAVALVNFKETTIVDVCDFPKEFVSVDLPWPVNHPAQWEGESDAWSSALRSAGIVLPPQ